MNFVFHFAQQGGCKNYTRIIVDNSSEMKCLMLDEIVFCWQQGFRIWHMFGIFIWCLKKTSTLVFLWWQKYYGKFWSILFRQFHQAYTSCFWRVYCLTVCERVEGMYWSSDVQSAHNDQKPIKNSENNLMLVIVIKFGEKNMKSILANDVCIYVFEMHKY